MRVFVGYEGGAGPAEMEAALRCLGVNMTGVVVRASTKLVSAEGQVREGG